MSSICEFRKNSIEAYWLQGSIFYQQEKWEEAFACFERVLFLNADYKNVTAELSKVKKLITEKNEKQEKEVWLREEAPQLIIAGVLNGLLKGVPAVPEFGIPIPLVGLGKENSQLSENVTKSLKEAIRSNLFTSQLLTQKFRETYIPLVIFQITKYLFSLFPGVEVKKMNFFSKGTIQLEGNIDFHPATTTTKLQNTISQGIAYTHESILNQEKKKDKIVSLSQLPYQTNTVLLRQRETIEEIQTIPLETTELDIAHDNAPLIKTVFNNKQPIEYATAMVALLRNKNDYHAFLVDSVSIFETPFGTSKSPKGTKIVDKYACGSPGRPAYARYDTTRCHNFTSTNDLSTVLWALYFAFGKTSGTTVYQGLSASLLRRFLGRQRMMRLSNADGDILEMNSYHLYQHPNEKGYAIVVIGHENITISHNDTQERILQEQDKILRREKFLRTEKNIPLENFHQQCFNISRQDASILHNNILADYQAGLQLKLPYSNLGDKSALNHSVSKNEAHNCFTWARKHLSLIKR